MLISAVITALLAIPGSVPAPATINPALRDAPADLSWYVVSDTEIYADGVLYNSWEALGQSGYFAQRDTRCGTHAHDEPVDPVTNPRGVPSDCSYNNTTTASAYAPSNAKFRIPVVVHVIQRTNGTGYIPESRVRSQIDVLNEDFLAIAGTNGGPGFDTQIEFYLATEDPDGNPTTGITYSTNNTWYNDGGNYWNSLNWDTNRYMNIYTNSASGALGYVPGLPQQGTPGTNGDRVVVLHSAFGRNSPIQNYNLGRTATHEVGHYLGLFHTFDGGCTVNGDRIADTNPESSPTYGCPGSRTSCSLPAPFDNYMDYSDDRCMDKFTHDQGFRMRCTLINYRPALYQTEDPGEPCPADVSAPFGTLDFFDIAYFISLYNSNDPAADTNQDGTINFFDISEYLVLFQAGCP